MPLLLPEPLAAAAPEAVLFWSGCGMSYDPPTALPLGNALCARTIACAFSDDLLDILRPMYERLRLPRELPRLETVLDLAAQEYGEHALVELLPDVATAPPNWHHFFFAEHLRAGGGHVTANFDRCIEFACAREASARLTHFHGALEAERPESAAGIGARITSIERGFEPWLESELDALISAAAVICIVGYSGSDYFDVDPYWRRCASRRLFQGRAIVWVNHVTSANAPPRPHPQMEVFRAGGATSHYVNCNTRSLEEQLARRWGLKVVDPPRERQEVALRNFDPERRNHATLRFLAWGGLYKELRTRFDGHALGADEHVWLGYADWAAGAYRSALRHWEFGYEHSPHQLQERKAAVDWVRGRNLRAYRAADAMERRAWPEPMDPAVHLQVAELLGRVLKQMHRSPDVWWLATKGRRCSAAKRIQLAARLQPRLGVHLHTRVQSVLRDLCRGSLDSVDKEPLGVNDFDQYEALLPMLHYKLSAFRRDLAANRLPPTADDFRWLACAFAALGAPGDAARIPLAKRAAPLYTFRDVWAQFCAVDFTQWHRIRLMTWWCWLRVRDGVGHATARKKRCNLAA